MPELFWAGAALLCVVALAFVALPLWQGRERLAGGVVVLLIIAGAGGLYWKLGNSGWIRAASAQSNSAVTNLLLEAQRNPKDTAAWLKLAQAYTTGQQFAAALNAYQRANSLNGGRSALALSGMAEVYLLSGDATRIPQANALLDQALAADPKNPKALFYAAVEAAQSGDLQLARTRFATMLTLDIPDNIRTALTNEVARIDTQLTKTVDKATAIQLNLQLAPALSAQVPAGSSLFVFVQSPGGGPPLAVKRLDASLPRQLILSAADSMIQSNRLTPNQKVHVVARISSSGRPIASAGDLYGELDTAAGQGGEHVLLISRVTPAGN